MNSIGDLKCRNSRKKRARMKIDLSRKFCVISATV